MGLRVYNYDKEMVLKDAGLVAASAAAQVASADKILDLGTARFEGVAVIDISAIETDSSNERYDIIIQGSNSADFSGAKENLAQIDIGHSSARRGSAATSTTGRYELMFTNEQDDVTYRYLRAYTAVAGTVATGINYKAFVAPLPGK